MTFRRIKCLSFCLCIAALLPSCARPEAAAQGAAEAFPSSNPPAVSEAPDFTTAQNETLTLSMRNPVTMNPLLNADITVRPVLQLLFEPLFRLDETLKPTPNLAESAILSEDGLTAAITLRPDIVWSDGQPLNATDVTFSLDMIGEAPEEAIYKNVLTNIERYEATGPLTLTIHYAEPDAASLSRLVFPVIPKHYYLNETNPKSPVNLSPIGCGRYILYDYRPGNSVTLIQNGNSPKGKPAIEKMTVLLIPNEETSLYAFTSGIIDAAHTTLDKWSKHQTTRKITTTNVTGDTMDFIGFNFNSPVLKDKRLRQAIAFATDLSGIVNNIYVKRAVRAPTAVHPNSWVFEPDTKAYVHDTEKANELLSAIGFTQGVPFTILVNSENTERVKIAEMLKQDLETVGIKAAVLEKPFNEYTELIERGSFDMFVGGFSMGYFADLSFAFHSDSTPERGGMNVFHYSNPVMDTLLASAGKATTDDAYRKAMSDIQKLFADDLPCISLAYRNTVLLTSENVKGDIAPLPGDIFANVGEWAY